MELQHVARHNNVDNTPGRQSNRTDAKRHTNKEIAPHPIRIRSSPARLVVGRQIVGMDQMGKEKREEKEERGKRREIIHIYYQHN